MVTVKKSILKLSAREERELRQVNAARRRARLTAENRASAVAGRWVRIRADLDARLVMLPDVEHQSPSASAIPKMSPLARKNIAVFERDNFTCRDCRKTFEHPEPYFGKPIAGLTRGHIVPAAQGGLATVENLIAQCVECNQALGNNIWGGNFLPHHERVAG